MELIAEITITVLDFYMNDSRDSPLILKLVFISLNFIIMGVSIKYLLGIR